MELIEVTSRLYLLRFDVGQAYLWRDEGTAGQAAGVTLIDAGPVGHGSRIRQAVAELAPLGGTLERIVLTHFHGDHAGSLAEIRRWSSAPVLAHRLDAPYVRGARPAPAPVLRDWERPLFELVGDHLTGPPAEVDHELEGGEVLDFGGGAHVLSIPGHTEGSIALHLPAHGVLFTGDTVAEHGGEVMPGVFNLDSARTIDSLRRLARLDSKIACFGHGEPVIAAASSVLRGVAAQSG